MILCGCTTDVYGRVAKGRYGHPPTIKSGGEVREVRSGLIIVEFLK